MRSKDENAFHKEKSGPEIFPTEIIRLLEAQYNQKFTVDDTYTEGGRHTRGCTTETS